MEQAVFRRLVSRERHPRLRKGCLGVLAWFLLFPSPAGLASGPFEKASSERPPNFLIVFADDLGYGDLGIYGHPAIRTPHLDRMAQEGQKWTSFYVAASVCTPSRAALLTGRLPIRNGMCSDERRVLFPDSAGGLPASEITLARALKELGYATACVGKWHLGHLPEYLPTGHGFDLYYGIPYSNDMDNVSGRPNLEIAFEPRVEYWNVPLMRNEEIVEQPADQRTITRRYTEEAVRFIRTHKERPFFLYLAHTMPHIPLFVSEEFEGKSLAGLYGSVVEEIDWSVGRLLDTLREENLAEHTLVVFTSDNGPWLLYETHGGSAGLLRGGKGGTFEGGMRVPGVFWWPGRLNPGVVTDMGSTLDLFPTFVKLAGASLPENRVLDGFDLSPLLFGTGTGLRDHMLFYRGEQIWAVRLGPYKAHFTTREPEYGPADVVHHDPPLLYHVEHDPSERHNLAAEHPDVLDAIRRRVDEHRKTLVPVESQLVKRLQPPNR